MRKIIPKILLTAILMMSMAVSANAMEYSIKTEDDTIYYGSTSYEDVYGSQYNYGGPNLIDYRIPELQYGNLSSTQTGVMERTILPGLQSSAASAGSGGYGVSTPGTGGGYGGASAALASSSGGFGVSSDDPTVVFPDSYAGGGTVEQAKYTSVSGMERSDGSIGTVSIPSLGISMKVWEGETNTSMAKGMGHYSSTSGWDGNVGVCGHNRGAKYVIGSVKDLKNGDKITYTTVYGTRTYQVVFVGTIANDDWSYLQATTDNRITITTCLADHPEVRVCVQAVEKS